MRLCPDLSRTVDFLTAIGLVVELRRKSRGFLSHVAIEQGILVIDPHASTANLLHEAGHMACIPAPYRHLAHGDLSGVEQAMMDVYASIAPTNLDSPLARALIQCSDPEATAWAWAAGTAIGLRPGCIIDSRAYGGEGDQVRACVAAGFYAGINGLRHAGMCLMRGPERYPKMLRWVQPDFSAEAAD